MLTCALVLPVVFSFVVSFEYQNDKILKKLKVFVSMSSINGRFREYRYKLRRRYQSSETI